VALAGQPATQAPTVDRPARLPLVIGPSNRDTSANKDARLVNCFVEHTEDDEYYIFKRPGLLANTTKSGNGLGAYNWRNDIYAIFGTDIYKNGVSIGTIDTTNGVYRFSASIGGTPRLVLGNGVKGYTYDGTTFAVISDADFPAAFVKGFAWLDATTYVMKSDASIQGSDLNDPTAWDPLNKIIAQVEPDGGVAIAKQLVYVIALKQWTTEVFYDAANATGSPLGTVQGAKVPYGCVSADSVRSIEDVLFWLGINRDGEPCVVQMSKVKADVVSTKAIDKLLKNADFTTVYSWTLKLSGHKFYVLTVKNSNLTLVYDMVDRVWHQWTDANGNYLPIVDSTFNSSNQHLVQHESNGILYRLDMSYTNDNGAVIPVDIYTPNYDGGSRRRKFLKVMEFIADQTTGSELLVRFSDDDYQTWSNYRRVDLGQKKPMLIDCGTFVKRAHHLQHRSNTTMRIQAVELQFDVGTL